MFSKAAIFFTALMAASVSGHMHMSDPAPLRAKENKFTTNVDSDINAPLLANGNDFPCKGTLDLVGTAQGASVASWAAGSQQSFTIDKQGAPHDGGSCQASLSEDGGKTWKVMKSIIGDCPTSDGGTFPFTVPTEAKAGDAIFAWSWFNKVGNREMYMNCAVVTITGTGGSGLDALPDMFVANIGNGCNSNAEGTGDLAFPNPGDDVTNNSAQSSPPTGASCQAASGGSGGSGSGGSAGNSTATATGGAGSGATATGGAGAGATATGGAGAGAGSGATATGGAGSGAATTQTFDDGQYHPPTSTAVGVSDATSAAATDSGAAAPTGSATNGTEGTEGDAYNIVMVIDGKTQTGMAYLTKPTATAAAARHRYHRRAHKFMA